MTTIDETKQDWDLTPEEKLIRHQLNVITYWGNQDRTIDEQATLEDMGPKPDRIPDKWSLLQNIELHEWQAECVSKWFESGKRGIVKVVTGAGKTILALGIIERLQNTYQSDLRVAIVVPTIVLMGQWHDMLIRYGNLPHDVIGRMGGGYSDDFSDKSILVCVLASASKSLSSIVLKHNLGDKMLLVVDECHRSSAEKMSQVFATPRPYSLGLSATPETEGVVDSDGNDNGDTETQGIGTLNFEDTTLGKELGPIIYELSFDEALKRDILPKFEIRHYGLLLGQDERARYESLSREITELRKMLQDSSKTAGSLDGGKLVGWARKVAGNPSAKLAKAALKYVDRTTKRKHLIYMAKCRKDAVIRLLRQEFAENPGTRAILFHESIAEVMRLFNILRSQGLKVVPENSRLPDQIRSEGIHLFRDGDAQVLVSARSLIEGFDVPAADVGIVVASSSSVRQRIQTLGRILRKHKGIGGEKKDAVLYVLYIANTVDEMIYEKYNWDSFTGAKRNVFYLWNTFLNEDPIQQIGPPRSPLPTENEIDWNVLKEGDLYLGRYDGTEFTCDTMGNIFTVDRRLISNPQGADNLVRKVKGSAGKFKVTPRKLAILVRLFEEEVWVTRFVGFLKEPFVETVDVVGNDSGPPEVSNLKPGDEYSITDIAGDEYNLKQRAHGPVIIKKIRRGEVFARVGSAAKDAEMGADAARLIEAVMQAIKKETGWIRAFVVNRHNHAIYLSGGRPRFLCVVQKGFEFPELL